MTSELLNPEIFRDVLERMQIGVYIVDTERRILFWNEGAERITGYLRHQVLGRLCRENILMDCDGKSCGLCGSACPLSETIHEGHSKEARVYFRHRQGHQVPVHLRVVPIRDDRGSVIGAAESFEELTADSHDADLAAYGCLDASTGVPNHAFTQSHLRESLATFDEYRVPISVLGIHVDQLGQTQSSHGHQAVEYILRVAAGTIKNVLGPGGFVGRWKDHEFLAILMAWEDAEVDRTVNDIQKIVNCSSVRWWDDPLVVHVSVVHTNVRPGDTVESLIERLDILRRQEPVPGKSLSSPGLEGTRD